MDMLKIVIFSFFLSLTQKVKTTDKVKNAM